MIRAFTAALLTVAFATPVTAPPLPARVLVAYVPGLAPGTPVPDAAVGALVVKTARHGDCPADFWLTLGAGTPAGLPGSECTPPVLDSGRITSWDAIVAANEHRHHDAALGTLYRRVRARGGCVSANLFYPPLAAAGPDGHVDSARCDVELVEVDSVRTALALAAERGATRTLLVSPPRGHAFGAVALTGANGVLRGTTGVTGLVTLPDLTDWLADGTSLTVRRGSASAVADLARRERLKFRYNGWYATAAISVPLLLSIAYGIRRRVPRWLAWLVASVPAAGFAVAVAPWWRAGAPGLAVSLGVAAAAAALAGIGIGLARVTRAPVEVGVAAASALLLFADAVTGTHLEQAGIASYAMVQGGRFHGVGNAGFAVLATAAVIGTYAAAKRWGATAWLLLLPVLAADALAPWGADFGGAIALTAAFVVAVAKRTRTLLLGLVAAAGIAVAAALADYARPHDSQTHLGRFVGDVLHGHGSDTLARKGSQAMHSVTGTWYPLLVVGSLLVLWLVRDRVPRDLARVLAVLLAVGSLVNDSGLVVAAYGLAVATPLMLSYGARA